jgi:hypothetical protein
VLPSVRHCALTIVNDAIGRQSLDHTLTYADGQVLRFNSDWVAAWSNT